MSLYEISLPPQFAPASPSQTGFTGGFHTVHKHPTPVQQKTLLWKEINVTLNK